MRQVYDNSTTIFTAPENIKRNLHDQLLKITLPSLSPTISFTEFWDVIRKIKSNFIFCQLFSDIARKMTTIIINYQCINILKASNNNTDRRDPYNDDSNVSTFDNNNRKLSCHNTRRSYVFGIGIPYIIGEHGCPIVILKIKMKCWSLRDTAAHRKVVALITPISLNISTSSKFSQAGSTYIDN